MCAEKRLNQSLRLFFDDCAARTPDNPTLEELCAASCKETRLWAQPQVYEDLMHSLREQLELSREHRLLEVGCAAGFLAVGLSALCAEYVGVDLSPLAIERAWGLNLPNARFNCADGQALPFPDETFDRVLSYDVFTNFPNMELARKVTAEMLRVTKSSGRILVGALPDEARQSEYFEHSTRITRNLESSYGPRPQLPAPRLSWLSRLQRWYQYRVRKVNPTITNYLFSKDSFCRLASEWGVQAVILENHTLSPYRGFRFNVQISKRKVAA